MAGNNYFCWCHICSYRDPNSLWCYDNGILVEGMIRMDQVFEVLKEGIAVLGIFDHRICRVRKNDLVEYDVNDMCSLKRIEQQELFEYFNEKKVIVITCHFGA